MDDSLKNKRYLLTALALYFTFFIHGIGASILAQYKLELSNTWGSDISFVIRIISILGLGRILALPLSGNISDKKGRKITVIIGVILYSIYFIGIVNTVNPNLILLFALLAGAANSFIDTSVIPAVLEIFKDKGDIANMFTKFSISLGQFILPILIGVASRNNLNYKFVFYLSAGLLILDGILILFLDFPEINDDLDPEDRKDGENRGKIVWDLPTIALILIGFTSTSTFLLWLNCNQELAVLYGLENPARIQSLYALGTVMAILFTSFVMLKRFKAVDVLVLYPLISSLVLIYVYLVRQPSSLLIGGFLIGFAAAGGVLQLAVSTANAMYPRIKGLVTSKVMLSSSLANYTILSIASSITAKHGSGAPIKILALNIFITIVGVVLALYLNREFKKRKI